MTPATLAAKRRARQHHHARPVARPSKSLPPAVDPAEPEAIATFVASQLVGNAKGAAPPLIDLASAITNVEVETSIIGASLLKVTLLDEDWLLMTTGWLNVDDAGFLDAVDVNYPPKSDYWWRLVAVDADTNIDSPNFVLTFEDRVVSELRDLYGPISVQRGTVTRAEFLRSLTKGVAVDFICPELGKKQPITSSSAKPTVTARKRAKGQGIAHGSLTVRNWDGSQMHLGAAELANMQLVLDTAKSHNVTPKCMLALVEICMVEASCGNPPCADDGTGHYSVGIIQAGGGGPSSCPSYGQDIAQCVTHALLGDASWSGGGGLIKTCQGSASPGTAAQQEQGSAFPARYDAAEAGAKAIIAAYGGAGLSSGGGASGAGTYSFTRGTTDNPDEDSWTAMVRLAQEVNWSLFSDGPRIYYMTGEDLLAQKPTAVIDRIADAENIANLKFTWDNALALDTPIPTPDGWTTMGDVREGDFVLASDGKPTRVVGTAPVMTGHACYLVRFDDGAEIVADAGHRWETTAYRHRGIRTTKRIAETLRTSSGEFSHRVRGAAKTYRKANQRTIVAVEPVPSVPVRCIQVAADDHLFLAGAGMVVTCNTAFQYRKSRKHAHAKIQRKASLQRPSSPTQGTLDIVCPEDAFHAGEVIILGSAGPADGRWIVADCTRSAFNTYSELTLDPPIAALPEPSGTGSGKAAGAATAGTVPGAKARINSDGTASAPANAPQAVQGLIAAANKICHKPYVYGGGHGGSLDQVGPSYDCSSSSSFALHGGGLMGSSAMTSGDFMGWGQAGPGQWVTVVANSGHMFLQVAGIEWDTSGSPASDGPRWKPLNHTTSGFALRHPPGL